MKAKITLEKGETREEAEELLIKALTSHRTGSSHSEQFPDKTMEHMANQLKAKHQKMFQDMMNEIDTLLDSEEKDTMP